MRQSPPGRIWSGLAQRSHARCGSVRFRASARSWASSAIFSGGASISVLTTCGIAGLRFGHELLDLRVDRVLADDLDPLLAWRVQALHPAPALIHPQQG